MWISTYNRVHKMAGLSLLLVLSVSGSASASMWCVMLRRWMDRGEILRYFACSLLRSLYLWSSQDPSLVVSVSRVEYAPLERSVVDRFTPEEIRQRFGSGREQSSNSTLRGARIGTASGTVEHTRGSTDRSTPEERASVRLLPVDVGHLACRTSSLSCARQCRLLYRCEPLVKSSCCSALGRCQIVALSAAPLGRCGCG